MQGAALQAGASKREMSGTREESEGHVVSGLFNTLPRCTCGTKNFHDPGQSLAMAVTC
jgi:hypothetical protein